MNLIGQIAKLRAIRPHYTEADLRELARQLQVPEHRIQELVSFYPHLQPLPKGAQLFQVCTDVACLLRGACELLERVVADVRAGRCPEAAVRPCHCLGRCDTAPAVLLNETPHRVRFDRSGAALDCEPIMRSPHEGQDWQLNPHRGSPPYEVFLKWRDNPTAFRAYAIGELERAGLRGMGGAGFPTARKWKAVAEANGSPKYVICNADESEPGTFKDRELLGRFPEAVIEGILVAALAVDASQGIVFIRHEYEPEAAVLDEAIESARARGLLGANAFGPARPFDIELVRSPGGYILGEETALLEALEGRRGEPRNRPPYPATHGLYGRPTLINNVETLVAAAAILARGADWWLGLGRNGAHGLKLVSVSGDVARPQVCEVELGTPVREIIERCGGVSGSGKLKAFAPGGVSSAWLPPEAADVPYDFESLRSAGSMLGSGGLIVLAEGAPIGDVALSICRFFAEESCGKCVPCRMGTAQVVRLLETVQEDPAQELPPAFLRDLAATLKETSICGLGQVALDGLLSLLQLFPDEVLKRTDRGARSGGNGSRSREGSGG